MRADFVDARPFGSGHINDTYRTWYDHAALRVRHIHQRVNHHVFKNPIRVMENVSRVTRHALDRLLADGNPEAHRRTPTCIPARDGRPYAIGSEGNLWRTYPFIERAKGYDEIESNEHAYQAARAFGAFQKLTADLTGERPHETVSGFHDTPKRLAALEVAISNDSEGLARSVGTEIDFARAPGGRLQANHRSHRLR